MHNDSKEMKEPAQYLRLKEIHPTAQKMQKLWTLADKLGLHISFYGHRTIVTDREFPDRNYDMHDLENPDQAISEFPPAYEYVLKFENPEFTEFQTKRAEEDRKRREAERLAAEEREAERKREAEEKERRKREREERQLLAILKEKYEGDGEE